jgi:hypothetical protein
MKTPSLVRSIERDLEAGHAAVVQIVSTGEALMERRLAEIPTRRFKSLICFVIQDLHFGIIMPLLLTAEGHPNDSSLQLSLRQRSSWRCSGRSRTHSMQFD